MGRDGKQTNRMAVRVKSDPNRSARVRTKLCSASLANVVVQGRLQRALAIADRQGVDVYLQMGTRRRVPRTHPQSGNQPKSFKWAGTSRATAGC